MSTHRSPGPLHSVGLARARTAANLLLVRDWYRNGDSFRAMRVILCLLKLIIKDWGMYFVDLFISFF